jgi:hypothetical protein
MKKTFDNERIHSDFLFVSEGIRNKTLAMDEAKALTNNAGKGLLSGSLKLKGAIELGAIQEIPELGITEDMLTEAHLKTKKSR